MVDPIPPAEGGVDWVSIRDEIAVSLVDSLSMVVQGAEIDLQEFVASVSADIVTALQLGRQDLVDELKGQMQVRAEALRLRASYSAWLMIGKTVGGIASVALRILSTGVLK